MQRIQTPKKPEKDRKVSFYAKEATRCPVCDASFHREELFSGRVSADEMTDELHRTYKPLHAFGEVHPYIRDGGVSLMLLRRLQGRFSACGY
ncbi:hypothetical protein MASR2M48_22830 [Spirochaetota bacterium]